ncbi:MAG: protoheme farnesyltransferase [Bacilli bacterium]|nr:protoheme farnesyltransferase [Bacilli bacterium]
MEDVIANGAVQEQTAESVHSSAEYRSDRPMWKEYITVSKFGIVFGNLLTTVASMMLAQRATNVTVSSWIWLATILGTTLVIASGSALNNYIDRDIDPFMKRTEDRALAQGRLNPTHVLIFAITVGVVGLFLLALVVNPLSSLLAFLGLFIYVWIYTAWTKRTTSLNTVIGGLSGSMPPLIGYAAVANNLDLTAWIFFLIIFLWQPPHFLALAIRRVDDYRRAGIPMLPVVRGFRETKRQMLRYTAALVPVSILLYATRSVGILYLITTVVLGIIYLVLMLQGFNAKDDLKWAKLLFKYSLYYVTIISLVIMVNAF